MLPTAVPVELDPFEPFCKTHFVIERNRRYSFGSNKNKQTEEPAEAAPRSEPRQVPRAKGKPKAFIFKAVQDPSKSGSAGDWWWGKQLFGQFGNMKTM